MRNPTGTGTDGVKSLAVVQRNSRWGKDWWAKFWRRQSQICLI